ncbi:MAG: DUF488 family protein [Hyphomonadaceae bacterium]
MQRLLHTIGYEGSTIEDVLATLEAAEIDCVLDVREVPISRKAGFSKSALSNKLEARGISYVHFKGLGDPKAGRIAAREGRFEDFRQIFHAHLTTESAQADLARATELVAVKTACLLCFERDPTNCHRLILANEMAKRKNFTLVNVKTKDRKVPVSSKGYHRAHDRTNAQFG